MENPIRELRHRLGLSRGELAKALGSDYSYVAALERGEYRLPARLKEGFIALGVDFDVMAEAVEAFRDAERKRIIARANAKLIAGG